MDARFIAARVLFACALWNNRKSDRKAGCTQIYRAHHRIDYFNDGLLYFMSNQWTSCYVKLDAVFQHKYNIINLNHVRKVRF